MKNVKVVYDEAAEIAEEVALHDRSQWIPLPEIKQRQSERQFLGKALRDIRHGKPFQCLQIH